MSMSLNQCFKRYSYLCLLFAKNKTESWQSTMLKKRNLFKGSQTSCLSQQKISANEWMLYISVLSVTLVQDFKQPGSLLVCLNVCLHVCLFIFFSILCYHCHDKKRQAKVYHFLTWNVSNFQSLLNTSDYKVKLSSRHSNQYGFILKWFLYIKFIFIFIFIMLMLVTYYCSAVKR